MEKYPAAILHTNFQYIFYPLVRSADVDSPSLKLTI